MTKTIEVSEIRSKDRKSHGKAFPGLIEEGAKAVIVPGESIRLFGERNGESYDLTFKVGDTAEYGSYNLSYLGPIIAITAKTVTVDKGSTGGRVKRLSLHEFNWRNRDFDLEEIRKRNAETMMCI